MDGISVCAFALTSLLSGCGAEPGSTLPSAKSDVVIRGQVMGGQQPIGGALIQVYAVSTAGDGAAALPLLTTAVRTNSQGQFALPASLGCPSVSSLIYAVAAGGNPGLAAGTNNQAATLMAVLGVCGDYGLSSFIALNELTTVSAVFSLAPFMTAYAQVGSGLADQPRLALAFVQAAQLVDSATGRAPGQGLPAGVTVPQAEIASLGNVLASCVNSVGGSVGDGSPCGLLFSATQPARRAAATETVGAALQIAQHPADNVSAIFNLASPASPFQPALSSAPPAWSLVPSMPFLSVYVDAGSQHPINPNIYGIASYGLDPAFAREIKVPNQRWGGDGTTRYNWVTDSSNAGFDFFFLGGNGQTKPVAGASADAMIRAAKTADGTALMTVPIIPYINSSGTFTCSFRVSIYGAQQATNPYVHPNGDDCGNSISSPGGAQLGDKDIYYNHIDNSPAFERAWVDHMVKTFGSAAQGGVGFYQLDNEPLGWSNTHRDVQPTAAAYSEIATLGTQYAAMIKQADPTAAVLGPSDFTLGGWIGTPSAQNGLFAGQYYLQQFAASDKKLGSRTLDYFDEHYYPGFSDPRSQLASTRTLWDPTYNGGTFVEQYFFYGPMQMIPRFKQWIADSYPGTRLALSEYSIDSGKGLVTDALAEADLLGIFGQQGVDLANMWSPPSPAYSLSYAFRLFRDYDGQGGQFGEQGAEADSADPAQLAVYAATRAADGRLTLVVLNKTTSAQAVSLALKNFTAGGPALVYQYTAGDLTKIVPLANVPLTAGGLTYTFPAYSATVLEIPR